MITPAVRDIHFQTNTIYEPAAFVRLCESVCEYKFSAKCDLKIPLKSQKWFVYLFSGVVNPDSSLTGWRSTYIFFYLYLLLIRAVNFAFIVTTHNSFCDHKCAYNDFHSYLKHPVYVMNNSDRTQICSFSFHKQVMNHIIPW